jgi:hypothetical protein
MGATLDAVAPRRSTSAGAARREEPSGWRGTEDSMAAAPPPPLDRVAERRRAAALARHCRDVEQLPIAEIARRLGRAPAMVKAYLYDRTGEKARAVKARYRGYWRSCGADTSPRNGRGDAYAYCRRWRPGAAAPKWTRERARGHAPLGRAVRQRAVIV